MKIRSAFVSNSSSCSFVIAIGNAPNIKELFNKLDKQDQQVFLAEVSSYLDSKNSEHKKIFGVTKKINNNNLEFTKNLEEFLQMELNKIIDNSWDVDWAAYLILTHLLDDYVVANIGGGGSEITELCNLLSPNYKANFIRMLKCNDDLLAEIFR
jgi:hypothetical protein